MCQLVLMEHPLQPIFINHISRYCCDRFWRVHYALSFTNCLFVMKFFYMIERLKRYTEMVYSDFWNRFWTRHDIVDPLEFRPRCSDLQKKKKKFPTGENLEKQRDIPIRNHSFIIWSEISAFRYSNYSVHTG